MSDLLHYIDPKTIIEAVGTIGVVTVIFAESGLFFGFFLPGDSLLFTAGLFASQGHLSLAALLAGCSIGAVAGDSIGYAFGRKTGPAIFIREDSFFFHKKHAEKARGFYEKFGAKTIFLARFIPVVRTFAPIIAGVANMPYKKFIMWNMAGGLFWVFLATLAGYFAGAAFPGIEKYLDLIIIIIILVSFIPVVIEFVREKMRPSHREP